MPKGKKESNFFLVVLDTFFHFSLTCLIPKLKISSHSPPLHIRVFHLIQLYRIPQALISLFCNKMASPEQYQNRLHQLIYVKCFIKTFVLFTIPFFRNSHILSTFLITNVHGAEAFIVPSTMVPCPCLLKIYQLWHLFCFYCDIDYIIQIHYTHSEYQGSAEILPGEGKISCQQGTL